MVWWRSRRRLISGLCDAQLPVLSCRRETVSLGVNPPDLADVADENLAANRCNDHPMRVSNGRPGSQDGTSGLAGLGSEFSFHST